MMMSGVIVGLVGMVMMVQIRYAYLDIGHSWEIFYMIDLNGHRLTWIKNETDNMWSIMDVCKDRMVNM
jgi:hypothetical protein